MGHAESWNYDGMRRCQRLPEVTHPVDSTRPATVTSNRVPGVIAENPPEIASRDRRRPDSETPADLTPERFAGSVGDPDRTAFDFEGFRVDFRRADPLLFRPSRGISKEHSMRSSGVRVLAAVVFTLATAAAAHAQGSFFTSLSGTVVDSSGGVIPGADVKVKNNGTGAEFNTVSGSDGGFTIPSLPGGTYS